MASATEAMLPRPFRVLESTAESHDTVSLTVASDGDDASAEGRGVCSPGQFNMLYAFGVGEVPISMSGVRNGAPVHTIRAVGAVTRALCNARPGDWIGVRGPFGTGWPLDPEPAGDLLLVAGGIGLAPLMPAFRAACAQADSFHRVHLLYGARTPADVLFRAELDALAATADIAITVDACAPEWTGPVGFVTRLLARTELDPTRTRALLCGPEIMMRACVRELAERGVPRSAIYVSLERNMECAIGHCGHCQLGPFFVCKDGPVLPYRRVEHVLGVPAL